jgi:outer membrane receptor protein involved in Fe transport
MNYKNKIILLTIILVSNYCLYAQTNNDGFVTGTVKDSLKNHPLEFVNVFLQNTEDSSKFSGAMTDHSGKFKFNNILFGNYKIKVSYLGFINKISQPFAIDSKNKNIDVGIIYLKDTTLTLEEVLVTSKKSLFNNEIDKKVYNVSQDIMSKSGSASDLLQNVPSVQVDIDGGVTLRGSSNVLIMVNGKTSPLMGRSQATILQGIPANTIEKIEVITNPSAKYRPDGTSGIINIVLKKNKDSGLNGNVNFNLGLNDRYNGGVQLNYDTGDFNFFGSYNLRKDNRKRIDTDKRKQTDSTNSVTTYNENNNGNYKPLSHFLTLGFDYSLDDANQFGLSGNYFYNSFIREDFSNRIYTNELNIVTENYNRNRYDKEYEKESDYTFYYEHKFPDEDHKIKVEFTGSHAPEQEDNHFTNIYYYPYIPVQYDNTLIKQTEDINQLTVEYSNPISEKVNLEAGYEGNFHKNDFDFYSEYFDATQNRFIKNIGQTNRFIYNEDIHAVYTIVENSFGQLGFQEGLRVEQSNGKANLVTNDSAFTKKFFNLYPTFHVSYNLNELTKLQLSYSRRVRRPESDDINPFPEYQDPRNIRAGNPNLLPEYTHMLEFGFSYQTNQYSIIPSIYYRYRSNGFTRLTRLINDTTSLTTEANLSSDQSGGFEFILSANDGKFFTTNLSADIFYNQIDASNLGYSNKKSIVSWSGNGTLNMNFTKTLMLQLNANYRSARLTPQGEFSPRFVFNIGGRQEFLDGKLALLLTVSDVFNSLRREININTPQLVETAISTRDSRIFYLGLSYNFGTKSKKSKESQLKYDEN